MGFNKKLLDHFSEILRCNQYPKRYIGDIAKIYAFSHRVTLSAYYINWGHNIEFQRTEGRRSIVICLNSVSIQRSALWLMPDMRLQRQKGGLLRGTRTAQKLTWVWASAVRDCIRLLFRSTSESKSPDERSKMREWSFWGGRREWAKHKHLSSMQQISIFKIPNSAVKFQGKWRPRGKKGFVLIWNVALCSYFVQDFLSAEQIILHPKQTLLFLLVTVLQLIITSHATMTNEHESHHYP